MASPRYNQPLINSPSTTKKTIHKILFFSFSIATLFSLIYFGSPIIQSKLSYYQPSNGHDHLLGKILSVHVSQINKALDSIGKEINQYPTARTMQREALLVCMELMELSRDRVAQTMQATKPDDINAWLSAVLSNHVTCLDQFQNDHNNNPHNLKLSPLMRSLIEGLISHAKSLLAVHKKVSKPSSMDNFLETPYRLSMSLPSWLTRNDMKLLETSGSEVTADVVVAKDGSGDFTTVAEAVANAPDKSLKRYVIYVKEGVYDEIVRIESQKWNLMIVGDGMYKTVITGSLNMADGVGTFNTPTLAAVGDGFILQDICIENTAGPDGDQAVALRVGAHKSVINRCKIDAYQDTLYAHSNTQFYRDCSISGTIDFIFGYAAAVLQNCEIIARKPNPNQKNMVTAHGRSDPNEDTGFSIQFCTIKASWDLAPVQDQFPTFLGRPWGNYSRTVVMQSWIDDLIHPEGWHIWSGDWGLDALYYAEYDNRGKGSDTSQRVNWPGYHVITDSKVAQQFTVEEFIHGKDWLDSDVVDYDLGLQV